MVLYLHILFACAWIGGSLFLMGIGLFFRSQETILGVYRVIGPFYGWYEAAMLVGLLVSGSYLFIASDLSSLLATSTHLGELLRWKIVLACLLTVITVIHFVIALRTHNKQRTTVQNLISRGSSLMIVVVNFVILGVAIALRSAL